jgi:hypothetical protein
MKTFISVLSLTLLLAGSLFADGQFRIAGDVSTEFAEQPSFDDALSEFDTGDQGDFFTGWHWEVIMDKIGFGMIYQIKFDETKLITSPSSDAWLDWKGGMFVSYHLFGGGSLIDPFAEIGYANAGRVIISDLDDFDYGGYDFEEYLNEGEAVTNMSLYPYIAGGVAIDLDGFLFGAKLSYHPIVSTIPVPFDEYPLKAFEVGIFGGLAFGGH